MPADDKALQTVRVFDVLGRLRYEGTWTDFQQTQLPNIQELMFCAFFDERGQFLRTEKIMRPY